MKQKKRRRKQPRRFWSKACVIFLVGIICSYAVYAAQRDDKTALEAQRGGAAAQDNRTVENPRGSASAETIPVHISEISASGYLELINRDFEIERQAETGLIVSAWPTVPVSTNVITVHETALAAVRAMFDAARDENIGSFYLTSGYRDFDSQAQIYDSMANPALVQPPGFSEHHTGLAVDILAAGVTQADFGTSREGKWIEENAWKFGLILRYPQGKENVTGIAYESWHFRYIGEPHARYCWENNLSFEEYIQFLKDSGGYSVVYGGIKYSILYELPENDIVNIPKGLDFSVSRDNTGGYIITIVK